MISTIKSICYLLVNSMIYLVGIPIYICQKDVTIDSIKIRKNVSSQVFTCQSSLVIGILNTVELSLSDLRLYDLPFYPTLLWKNNLNLFAARMMIGSTNIHKPILCKPDYVYGLGDIQAAPDCTRWATFGPVTCTYYSSHYLFIHPTPHPKTSLCLSVQT